jgi:serine/threonine protein kinase
MGAVCGGYDSRLKRDVAIKVSNPQFPKRVAHEVRTIATLDHANICYLVMENVEGEDLRGPLGIEDALRVLRQLIASIEAAQRNEHAFAAGDMNSTQRATGDVPSYGVQMGRS